MEKFVDFFLRDPGLIYLEVCQIANQLLLPVIPTRRRLLDPCLFFPFLLVCSLHAKELSDRLQGSVDALDIDSVYGWRKLIDCIGSWRRLYCAA